MEHRFSGTSVKNAGWKRWTNVHNARSRYSVHTLRPVKNCGISTVLNVKNVRNWLLPNMFVKMGCLICLIVQKFMI